MFIPFSTRRSWARALTLTIPSSASAKAKTGLSPGTNPDLLKMETMLEIMCSDTRLPASMYVPLSVVLIAWLLSLSQLSAFPTSFL